MKKTAQKKLTNYFTLNEQRVKSRSDTENIEAGAPPALKRQRVSTPQKPVLKEKKVQSHISPMKFVENFGSVFFDDDFGFDDLKRQGSLNLEKLQRFEVLAVEVLPNSDLKIEVKATKDPNNCGTCTVKTPWNGYAIKERDVVSLKGCKTDDGWVVEWGGLLVVNPDHLVSTTQIVQSLYCTRKTVLSGLFNEIGDRGPDHMVIGCIVHELLEVVLMKKCTMRDEIEKVCDELTKGQGFTVKMFMEGMDYEKTVERVRSYLPSIFDFVTRYMAYSGKHPNRARVDGENWNGEIADVIDIEENIWSPTLGVKGKIDATVRVRTPNNRNILKLMPLELKTGKVSFSLEHRGQVILYCMLLRDLGERVDAGLLLYLKDSGGIKEIAAAEREMRDLTLLRNGLSQSICEIEKAQNARPPVLPNPINRKSCTSCGHLIACFSALRIDGLNKIESDNILREVGPGATAHLKQCHLEYVFRLVALQTLENGSSKSSAARIWSEEAKKREEKGRCFAGMAVESCTPSSCGRYNVSFVKADSSIISAETFSVAQTVAVSQGGRAVVAMGFVKSADSRSVQLLLDRCFKPGDKVELDAYESNALLSSVLSNIGLFLENTPTAEFLRESIIEKKIPKFAPKLTSKVKKLGQGVLEKLNREQCRAVLQALAAERYILVKGMAGTGKSTTLRALITLLHSLGKRVLLTAYTHSAVDNILERLVDTVPVLRIGPDHRIKTSLRDHCESSLIRNMEGITVEKLEKAFQSYQVVGVTCHGASHLWLQRQRFDYCIVDEATQVTQTAVLRPLFLAEKFVLVGDPKQLPPLVLDEQAKALGLGESLFQRLDCPAVTTVLKEQYRMNRKINEIANGLSYGGELRCANDHIAEATIAYPIRDDAPAWLVKALSGDIQDSFVIVDIHAESKMTNSNELEATAVERIVNELAASGADSSQIGVVATYREQVNLIRRKLNEPAVEVNTVDQYQGRDKEIILYSTSKNTNHNHDDITADMNRLTVAVTRARKKFILVCDKAFITLYSNFDQLIRHIPAENTVKYF
ncbi:DNA replication ATP-dependent helicase/nuclease DNA2 [Cimex lectularius]|uniref:DNA helicase n=1 Tax=Cimex lectularius TaxID=79782 RepID=A0A8I6S4E9_CIMLE|nr:DNA replication ATP-dependent helicase/nuclease DNA2 [Cimex lectularius]